MAAGGRRRGGVRGAFWDWLKVYGLALALVTAAFVVAYQFVEPAPPSRIVMASGAVGGAYRAHAERYRELLARDDITVEIRGTAGSMENLALLDDPASGVDVAFVQAGTGVSADRPDLRGLASLYFEPLWMFHRADAPVARIADLRGRAVAAGMPGSGTRSLLERLYRANGLPTDLPLLAPLTGEAAIAALIDGRVDALFTVAGARAEIVQVLLRTPGIALASFEQAEAYRRHMRFLSPITLPRGAADLAADLPPRDVTLLAPAATLVAREDLHPALVGLLMRAATEIHREGGLFEEPDQFPTDRYVDFPMNDTAERYLKSGPSWLQRWLPFWAATLADRLLVMLIPLLTLALPLARILPPVYQWRIRSRIYRWYKRVSDVDLRARGADAGELPSLHRELDAIDREVSRISVPASYADQLYHLRMHIDLVRHRMGETR